MSQLGFESVTPDLARKGTVAQHLLQKTQERSVSSRVPSLPPFGRYPPSLAGFRAAAWSSACDNPFANRVDVTLTDRDEQSADQGGAQQERDTNEGEGGCRSSRRGSMTGSG